MSYQSTNELIQKLLQVGEKPIPGRQSKNGNAEFQYTCCLFFSSSFLRYRYQLHIDLSCTKYINNFFEIEYGLKPLLVCDLYNFQGNPHKIRKFLIICNIH